MANIVDVILVKELRERTGIGIMDCKKALVEAKGDIELAIIKMRHYGQVKAVKKAGRMTAEGIILITISQNRECGVIIEINCETDFVAKDTCFKMFGKEVVSTALDRHILNLDVLRAEFEKQRSALIAKTGENIQISRLGILEGGSLVSYLHYTRIGVIVSATTGANEKLMKHVAMHIAASKPEYINEDDAPVDILERERQIQLAIARKSSKTPEVAEKMVAGRMQQFTDKIFLTDQHFIIDPSKTVGQLLKEHNTKINRFIRFEVGDGIDKT